MALYEPFDIDRIFGDWLDWPSTAWPVAAGPTGRRIRRGDTDTTVSRTARPAYVISILSFANSTLNLHSSSTYFKNGSV